MTNELDKRQAEEQAANQQKVISENADALFRSPHAYVAGNPNGDVTVVEFFDYNCGFCKRALPEVVELIESDGKVRVVLKELPIFGEELERGEGRAGRRQAGQVFRDAPEVVHRARQGRQGQGAKAAAVSLASTFRNWKRTWKTPRSSRRSTRPRILPRSSACKARRSIWSATRSIPGAPDDLYDQCVKDVAQIREKGCKATC